MRILLYSISLLSLMIVPVSLHAEAADDFLNAYFLIQDGDAAEKGGEAAKAIEKYLASLKILRSIKRAAPEWNPNVISYRSKYCADHILKAGGKIEPEDNTAASPLTNNAPTASSPVVSPVNTIPPTTATSVPPPVTPSVSSEASIPSLPEKTSSVPSDRIASLEHELQQARDDLRKVQEEKSDLESRLKQAEDALKSATPPGDERVQALLKENNSLKQQLAETEAKLKELPTNSAEIASLKEELAKAQLALETTKKENEDLKTANISLKKDLEDTQNQLKMATPGTPAIPTSDTLATLQKENSLLRSIVDRQFQEDAKRTTAREALSQELKDLGARTEKIRAQLEVLQAPLTALSEDERQLLKTPSATLRVSNDDPNKLNAVLTSKRESSPSDPNAKLSSDNTILVSDAKRLFAKNDIEGAATKYEQILQSEPGNLFALSNLGVIRFRQDKIEDAEKIFKDVLAISPQDAFSLSRLGLVHYRQGKYDDAISDLTRSIVLDPNNYETHNYLGIAYAQKGYQEAAEKELLKAIGLKPDYGEAHFNLAVIFASQTPPSTELARKHYKRALACGTAEHPELEKLLNK